MQLLNAIKVKKRYKVNKTGNLKIEFIGCKM